MPDELSNDAINESSFSTYPTNSNSQIYGMGWLLPLFLLILVAALVLYFINGSNNSPLPVAQQFIEAVDTSTNKISASQINSGAYKLIEIELPNHSVIKGSNEGIELRLVEFLNNQRDTINKSRWFNFDSLSFGKNNITLVNSSIHQIQNIVAILKAYPKMKIKIGAFKDKTNDVAEDLKLTEQQASEVSDALKKAGVNSAQIVSADGYGSRYAKALENAPATERMKDRKISINVIEK
jgi:outer membrane protein OmpA-like peptidoglycan-associated protein